MNFSSSTFRWRIAISIAVVCIFTLTFARSVQAQESINPEKPLADLSSVDFSIESLSPYIVQNSPLRLTINTKAKESLIRIEVMKATNTRSELFRFANDLGKRRINDSLEIPLSSFTPDAQVPQRYSIDIPVNGDQETSLQLKTKGVLPIAISQKTLNGDKTQTQYSFTTYVAKVGTNGAAYSQRLKVVPTLKFSPAVDFTNLIDENKSLTAYGKQTEETFLNAQEAFDTISKIDVPKTILLNPESFDIYTYIKRATTSQASQPNLFKNASNDFNEFVADSYVPVSITELEKQGSTSSYPDLVASGRSTLTKAGFSAPARTLITKSISKNTIDLVARTGIDRLIVEDTNFSTESRPAHRPAKLIQNKASLSVATLDTEIAENIPSQLSPSAKANYLIAATSVVALEAPSLNRGLILPLDLQKLSAKTLSQFLSAANESPLTKATTTDGFFNGVQENKAVSKKLIKSTYPVGVAPTFSLSDRHLIDKYTSATESCFSSDSTFSSQASWMRLASFSRADRRMTRYVSAQKAKDLTMEISKLIDLPKERTLTITSRENEIPVTIRRNYDEPISVIVSISGDKLAFPEGRTFSATLDQENTTISVPVKARTSGSFRISIEVVTAESAVVLSQQNATVRSTVVSGAGLAIAIASLAFLAVWWATHAHRSRKKPIAPVIELTQENAV